MMASRLSRLLKNAGGFRKATPVTNRLNRLGARLRVEELEDRIAPATLVADEYITWDGAANGNDDTWNGDDGVLFLGGNSTAGITATFTLADTTGPGAIAFTGNGGGGAVDLFIGTNLALPDMDFSGITNATQIDVYSESGMNFGGATFTAGNAIAAINVAGTASGGAAAIDADGEQTGDAAPDNTDPAIANAASDAVSGTGTMTLGTGWDVQLIAESGITNVGTIDGITGGAATDTLLGLTAVTSGPITNGVNWAGEVNTNAGAITFQVADDTQGDSGAFTFESVVLDTNNLTINADGLAGLTVTNGITDANAAGTFAVNADVDNGGATADGITGGVNLGPVTLTFNSAVNVASGDSGITGAVQLGAVDLSGGADILINTAANGDIAGATTVGTVAIDDASTLTIQPNGGGTGSMNGVTMGAVSIAATATNATPLTIGSLGGDLGALQLAGVTNNSAAASTVRFLGDTIGGVTSTGAILSEGNAASAINFTADDGLGVVDVTGNVGGALGDVTFESDNNADGTGSVTSFTSSATIGNDAANVTVNAVNIGDIQATDMGTGGGAVAFTADDPADTDGGGTDIGTIGNVTIGNNLASGAGGVTFTADDGMGNVDVGQDAAQGGVLQFLVNQDGGAGADDSGSMGTIDAQSLGDSDSNDDGTLDVGGPVVTINTNGGAADKATARPVGAITVTDGNANLAITADGTVGAINITGSDGAFGNGAVFGVINLGAAADDATNVPNLTGITLGDTVATADDMLMNGNWTIPGTMGTITVGGSDATDVMNMATNNINVYSGDDLDDGVFDTGYASTNDSNVVLVAGDIINGGLITANTRAASNIFEYTKDGETFAVSVASDVTARVVFDPDAAGTGRETVQLHELAGTSDADDVRITTDGASLFDAGPIIPAADGLDVRQIVIEGDLVGNLGTAVLGFGDVDTIIIQGADNGNTYFGNTLQGYASTDGTLVTVGVNVESLDTPADGTYDIDLIAGSIFRFADATGAADDVFNHHIAVDNGDPGATAVIRGIDGDGDSTADAEYLFDGNGQSTAQAGASNAVDPSGLIDGSALISWIMLGEVVNGQEVGVGGLSTDVNVREVSGYTNGSWFEFEQNVGLFNIMTQIDSISVGIDDNGDLADNAVALGIAGTANTRNDFDRLGGGQAGQNKRGLEPATFVTNPNAALGNMVVQSIGDPGIANNVNIAVTGNSGPITLTGDTALQTPDHGNFTVNNSANSAAIAIGGDLAGALTIPGQLAGPAGGNAGAEDILIGVGVDLNNDADVVDTALTEVILGRDLNGDGDATDVDVYSELPGGDVLAGSMITIGDAPAADILVAGAIHEDILVQGQDQDIELPGNELLGSLNGVKSGGILGDDQDDDVVVAGNLSFIISDSALNADIFTGGDNDGDTRADTIQVEGVGISGAAVLGGSFGIDQVDIINHTVAGDVSDQDRIAAGGEIVVQWQAGGIAADTIGDVYALVPGVNGWAVTNITGEDAMTVGDTYVLDAPAAMAFATPGDMGTVVVADDADVPTSAALQALITGYDVVSEPTFLDTLSGDEAADLNANTIQIQAENCDGVIAEGDIVTAGVGLDIAQNLGFIVSLNGLINTAAGEVHAGSSIGNIVASEDIDGTFVSEGTLAVDNAFSSVATLEADLTTFGLSGVPAWFLDTAGGVLSEAGNIGANADEDVLLDTGTSWDNGAGLEPEAVFTASGEALLVDVFADDPEALWVNPTMGTFYVPAGEMSADINVGGAFGGIQVPAGATWVELTVPDEATISRIIAPQFFDGQPGYDAGGNAESSWNEERVRALVIDGQNVVAAANPLSTPGLSVSVVGGGTLAIIDANGDIEMIDGLDAGAELHVTGDVDNLDIRGDWAGLVDVNYNPNTDEDGVVGLIVVDGAVVAGADLEAHNYGEIRGADLSAVTATGTLTGINSPNVTFTNLAGVDQTLYLDANTLTTANYTTVFGKVTDVDISGIGSAALYSVNEAVTDAADAAAVARNASYGLYDDGSAHVGDVDVEGQVMLRGMVVDGDLGDLSANRAMGINVSGDAGDVNVGGMLINAQFGGDVNSLSAPMAINATVQGDAATVSSDFLVNVRVNGATNTLNVGGTNLNNPWAWRTPGVVVNSVFRGVAAGTIFNPTNSWVNVGSVVA